jgi:Cytochrome P460
MARYLTLITLLLFTGIATGAEPPTTLNGITLFKGYENWQVIAPSYRPDKDHIRLILGNDLAIRAMTGEVRPFPDGAVMAKVAWSTRKNPRFPVAVEPDKFVQVEFMVKDSKKYATTGGWGFARFLGPELKPYGKDAGFVQECFGCHIPVKDNDYVFTHRPAFPQ